MGCPGVPKLAGPPLAGKLVPGIVDPALVPEPALAPGLLSNPGLKLGDCKSAAPNWPTLLGEPKPNLLVDAPAESAFDKPRIDPGLGRGCLYSSLR